MRPIFTAERKTSAKTPFLFFVMLAICCALFLGGCGRGAAPAAEDGEPTPAEAAFSLRDMGLPEAELWLDGEKYYAFAHGGQVWVECRELQERFAGFSWQEENGRLTLSDRDGHQTTLTCAEIKEGQELPAEAQAIVVRDRDNGAAECWVSPEALTTGLSFRSLYDTENDTWYISPAADTSLIPRGMQVPVLMYHAVSDDWWGLEGLFMSPATMRAHLRYLVDSGYDPIFFSDLTHAADYDKPVIVTFDDGYNNNYDELLPILEELNVKATVFMITGNMDHNPNFMTREQVKELSDSPLVEIDSHTVLHRELGSLSEEEQLMEIRDSQIVLARVTGKIPNVISYPAGSHDDTTMRLAAVYYDFAVDSRGDMWTVSDDFYQIDRYPIYRWAEAGDLQALLP